MAKAPVRGPSLSEIADTDVLDKFTSRMGVPSSKRLDERDDRYDGRNDYDARDRDARQGGGGSYRKVVNYGGHDMEDHRRAVARDLDYSDAGVKFRHLIVTNLRPPVLLLPSQLRD